MDPELYQAIIYGDQKFFENLRDADSYDLLQVTSGHKNSIIHVAAKCGEMQIAEKIIALCPSLLHQTNTKVEVEKELLRMQNLDKDTALHEAARNGNFEVVSLLVNEDPELAQIVNNAGESSLFLAVDRKFYKIACLIHEVAPACSYGGRNSMNVLHVAIIRADKNFMFVVTSMVINIIVLCSKIFVLCINQFLPAASKLHCLQIKHSYRFSFIGADFMSAVLKRCPSAIAEADKFGWIPLQYAAYLGNAEIVELLLQFDTSQAYVKDKEGMSALHISAKAGHGDVTLQLITKYPDMPELLDNRGRTALHVAAESGKRSVVKIFLSTSVTADLINDRDKDGNTPLHWAALQGRYEILLMLVNDYRVDKGAINNVGMTTFDIIKSSMQLKQHEKAKILWKLRARGALRSSEPSTTVGTMKVEVIETQGSSKENKVKHVALHGEAEPVRQKKDASEHMKEIGNVYILVATIIATVTFAASLTLPGGYYSDDQDSQGMAILSKKSGFRVFVIANSFAFGLSTASMFLHFGASGVKRDYTAACLAKYAALFNKWSIYAMVLAFLAGTSVVLTESLGLAAASVTTICFICGPLIYSLVTCNSYT
ncbi:ankyrin repeat-containing protein ITN1 isoform X3 [Hevea brasiliensis]|uniref:ankyrin repeat-containing protein ITN1 isoform X3 n=2 Tax=Hevea brasiliensis TaxID=3981 RepID=UPI0025CF2A80|nr:ankyrin repeat-containing protein ITN1 isoform X3 [Hevea brasiliensis]